MPQPERDVGGRMAPEPSAGEYDLVRLAAAMRSLSDRVAGDHGERARSTPWWGSPSSRSGGPVGQRHHAASADDFTTAASTAEQAVRADVLQYESDRARAWMRCSKDGAVRHR